MCKKMNLIIFLVILHINIFNKSNYDHLNKLKWQTDNLKVTSYLIKNQDQFIHLLQKHNPKKYQNKEKIIKEHNELLEK
ncbi:Uncharacterised protein (plasmid) [Mycoplasmopsis bovirhinis]|uniref:Uncharacterized protein n=2 Tax=Mycoplasmopsis bovirhinis TaxID=29553 RepID=A0A449AH39_9BACT|nr:Uncharacterised protein [Mycoplasmopsis bovirhinis]